VNVGNQPNNYNGNQHWTAMQPGSSPPLKWHDMPASNSYREYVCQYTAVSICPAGQYAAPHAECTPCEAGKFSAGAGATACESCPIGATSYVGATACGCIGCNCGYPKINGVSYTVGSTTMCLKYEASASVWETAQNECNALGGWLTSIRSAEEQAVAVSACITGECFIGLRDTAVEGIFRWVEDESLGTDGYTNWKAGNPDNWGSGQHYAIIWGASNNYQWDDAGITTQIPYLCQFTPTTICQQGQHLATTGIACNDCGPGTYMPPAGAAGHRLTACLSCTEGK
jgi:hypothetical protein